MNKEDPKPRSFRLNDEVFEKIREISNTLGANQQDTLSALINAYEHQDTINTMPEDAEAIRRFEEYQAIQYQAYLDAIKAKRDARQLAKTSLHAELESKDTIIMEMQEKVKAAESEKDEALKSVEPLENQIRSLSNALEEEKAEHKRTEESSKAKNDELETIIKELTEDRDSLKAKDTETRALYEENVKTIVRLQNEIDALRKAETPLRENLGKLKAENAALSERGEYLEKENENLESSLESLKTSRNAEISLAVEQAVFKTKNEMMDILEKERTKTEEFREKYYNLISNAADKEKK